MLALNELCPHLSPGPDGIWVAADTKAVSYPEHGHSNCFAVEDHSFWFAHRNRCIQTLVQRHPPPGGGTIIDVGGGNGFVAAGLRDAGFEVALVEPGIAGARNARRRGLETVICASFEAAAFPDESIAAAGLFDVIEHIADESGTLLELHRALKPGGRVYLTVPAHDWLWSEADDDAGHQRRYTRASISTALQASGFEVDYASYYFRYLLLPIAVLRALPYRLRGTRTGAAQPRAHTDEHRPPSPLLTRVLDWLAARERTHIARGVALRYGASCLVAGSKPARR